MNIQIVDHESFLAACKADVVPDVSFLAFRTDAPHARRYVAAGGGGHVHPRTMAAITYVDALYGRLPSLQAGWSEMSGDGADSDCFLFQANDCPSHTPSVSWQSAEGWSDVRLVPDHYYFDAGGYVDFLPPGHPGCPDWNARSPVLIWRGSTTGILGLTDARLEALPRYSAFLAAKACGASADLGFTNVVQATSPEEEAAIARRLGDEGGLKAYVPFDAMAGYKFTLDIDGNANSWNFIKKLRLGCCVLKVDGPWRQWFSDRLIPWRHYVPVAADGADLAARIDWCLSHDDDARQIAANGRKFGLDMDFNAEMQAAARQILAAFAPLPGKLPSTGEAPPQ